MSGLRWCGPVTGTSRIGVLPFVEAPPAASRMKLIGQTSYSIRSLPFGDESSSG
jgi:hypothetical protein